jgi:hypothetical protein
VLEETPHALWRWCLQHAQTLGGRQGEVQELRTNVLELPDRLDVHTDWRAVSEGEHEKVTTVSDRELDVLTSRIALSPQPWSPVRAPAGWAASVDLDLSGRKVEVAGKDQPQQPPRQPDRRLTFANTIDVCPLV